MARYKPIDLDELTELARYIFREYSDDPEEAVEQVKDVLIKEYRDGWDYLEYQLSMYGDFEPELDINKLQEALYVDYDGETFENRIRDYSDAGDEEAFVRVVQTETHRMFNAGSQDAASMVNRQVYKTWTTMQDDRVRETHDYLEGVTVPVEDEFYTYDGDYARFPGDFKNAANNVNCRCILNYTIKA